MSQPSILPTAQVESRLDDLRRSERIMVWIRWGGVAFALVQVASYRILPYPPGIRAAAYGLVAVLAAANVVIMVLSPRVRTVAAARSLSLAALALDTLVISAFVWLWAFDQDTAIWAVVYIVPLEGAIRFALPGALGAWGAAAVLYTAREVWGSSRYGYPLLWESISFRMGLALMIALVAGLMARTLIRQRARLSSALAERRRVDALRSRMVATLAHDVRNPLTTIRGTLQTLGRHMARLDERTRDELIARAEQQAARMERLAADLLDLARMESGRLVLHVEDMRLDEVVERGLAYADSEHRFTTDIPPDIRVRADPGRLEQIVVNLAANALRYGEPPFTVDARTPAAGLVTMSFRDHGPGIPEDERASLFEPFRAESARGSVGLGLAIVQAVAEAHGGAVAYEPNEPRGACFLVTLPAGSMDRAPAAARD